ncbi:MAG TPA: serine/threonine-protein kinase [Candidatus Eremiobacteraeota bacterium]|nr:MAG: Serine/threonine-protein kinase PrkC [bacterium ADurb.Bin363]HPZ09710.1 serine/threonine-protein kinase [Candidatus Eremiobacteraeota bacterium]
MRSQDGALLTHTILKDTYKILELVHIGPTSRMYKGINIKNSKFIFIKELIWNLDPSLRHQAIEQFKCEAKILFKLKYQNLPKFEDYFDEKEGRYLIIDYVEGIRLNTYVENHRGFIPQEQVIRWGINLCDTLAYLHNQKPGPIIFRDMSPQNILLSEEGQLKLIDFGISKLSPGRTLGIAKTITHHYSPLEQYSGTTDERSDIYSLGATLYYLITKKAPMDSIERSLEEEPLKPCSDINPNISLDLEEIILKSMELYVKDRYQKIEEMTSLLRKIKESKKTTETPKSLSIEGQYKADYKTHALPELIEKQIFFKTKSLTPSKNISGKIKGLRTPDKKRIDDDIPDLLTKGTIVKGKYKIVDLIRANKLSRVYKGSDIKKATTIAMKELFIDIYLKPGERIKGIEDFHAETKTLLTLTHQNLPKFEDYFHYEGRNYIIMEYIEGETLKFLIEGSDNLPSLGIILDWAMQICNVLNYLHKRKPKPIIFRGLCPENIMLDSTGKIKLIDFGLSKLYDPYEQTLSVAKIANLYFSPPEQYNGKTDTRSDIYSFGATLYYLLTGEYPTDAVDRIISEDPFDTEFIKDIPQEILYTVTKSTELEPDARFQSISEIMEILESLLK